MDPSPVLSCPISSPLHLSVNTPSMSYNITSKETQPTTWLHLNGTPDQILDRYCVSELINGWPVYRDASEWKNYRQCFADDAYVFTSKPFLSPSSPLPLSLFLCRRRRPQC